MNEIKIYDDALDMLYIDAVRRGGTVINPSFVTHTGARATVVIDGKTYTATCTGGNAPVRYQEVRHVVV